MNCPSCLATQLKQVQIVAHHGKPIVIDQCPNCKGMWFDIDEYYKIPEGEISKLETAQTENFAGNKAGDILTCPSGHGKLIKFKDLNFPKDILVEKCPECHGLWFNKGELSLFHSWKISLVKNKGEEQKTKLQQDLEKILEAHSSSSSYSALARLSAFLSTPVERSRIALNPMGPLLEIVWLLARPKKDSQILRQR